MFILPQTVKTTKRFKRASTPSASHRSASVFWSDVFSHRTEVWNASVFRQSAFFSSTLQQVQGTRDFLFPRDFDVFFSGEFRWKHVGFAKKILGKVPAVEGGKRNVSLTCSRTRTEVLLQLELHRSMPSSIRYNFNNVLRFWDHKRCLTACPPLSV